MKPEPASKGHRRRRRRMAGRIEREINARNAETFGLKSVDPSAVPWEQSKSLVEEFEAFKVRQRLESENPSPRVREDAPYPRTFREDLQYVAPLTEDFKTLVIEGRLPLNWPLQREDQWSLSPASPASPPPMEAESLPDCTCGLGMFWALPIPCSAGEQGCPCTQRQDPGEPAEAAREIARIENAIWTMSRWQQVSAPIEGESVINQVLLRSICGRYAPSASVVSRRMLNLFRFEDGLKAVVDLWKCVASERIGQRRQPQKHPPFDQDHPRPEGEVSGLFGWSLLLTEGLFRHSIHLSVVCQRMVQLPSFFPLLLARVHDWVATRGGTLLSQFEQINAEPMELMRFAATSIHQALYALDKEASKLCEIMEARGNKIGAGIHRFAMQGILAIHTLASLGPFNLEEIICRMMRSFLAGYFHTAHQNTLRRPAGRSFGLLRRAPDTADDQGTGPPIPRPDDGFRLDGEAFRWNDARNLQRPQRPPEVHFDGPRLPFSFRGENEEGYFFPTGGPQIRDLGGPPVGGPDPGSGPGLGPSSFGPPSRDGLRGMLVDEAMESLLINPAFLLMFAVLMRLLPEQPRSSRRLSVPSKDPGYEMQFGDPDSYNARPPDTRYMSEDFDPLDMCSNRETPLVKLLQDVADRCHRRQPTRATMEAIPPTTIIYSALTIVVCAALRQALRFPGFLRACIVDARLAPPPLPVEVETERGVVDAVIFSVLLLFLLIRRAVSDPLAAQVIHQCCLMNGCSPGATLMLLQKIFPPK